MKYNEIINEVMSQMWVKPFASVCNWRRLRPDGTWELDDGRQTITSIAEMEIGEWIVKPNQIIIFGMCNEDGESMICETSPTESHRSWFIGSHSNNIFLMDQNDLFTRGQEQKFLLTPIIDKSQKP